MSQFTFRFVIIENGANNATNYYHFVPREPSPEGGFLIHERHTQVQTTLTLGGLLDIMTGMGGGYLLALAHGTPRHVKIPLAAGTTNTLDEAAVDKIEELALVDQDIAAIKTMPETTGPERLAKLARAQAALRKTKQFRNEPIPDIETANARVKDFENQSVSDLFGGRGNAKKIQEMWDLAAKARAVKKLNFRRVEFRACRVGSNLTLMRKLRTFFNCQALTAPRFRVFRALDRAMIKLRDIPRPKRDAYVEKLAQGAFKFCGPCGLGTLSTGPGRVFTPGAQQTFVPELTTPSLKDGLGDHVVGDKSIRRFKNASGDFFDLEVRITNENPSECSFNVRQFHFKHGTSSFGVLEFFEMFERQFVYSDVIIQPGAMILGGMWVGAPAGFVLANEKEYVDNLVTVTA